ncbi:MAG TPA: TraR/DksA family transcriptional regulator [Burkholderiales bacterium]|nr:TraR/DksA family transcriptional regulator [Burkholderiales bacterium]
MVLEPQQLQELKSAVEQRLSALRAELREDLRKVREARFEDLAGAAPDAGDDSVASLLSDLDQADATRDLSELRALDAARQRIEQGSYGQCSRCGLEIGFARLRANPAAERCIECQTLFEKTHASPAGSTL